MIKEGNAVKFLMQKTAVVKIYSAIIISLNEDKHEWIDNHA